MFSALDDDSAGFDKNGVKPDGVQDVPLDAPNDGADTGVGVNIDVELPDDPNDGALEGLWSSAGVSRPRNELQWYWTFRICAFSSAMVVDS